MKKIISMITSLVMTMLLISAFSMTGSAEFVTENGITFAINKGIATVYGVEDDVTDLVIPEYVGENKVDKINLDEEENLKSITIPSDFTNITQISIDKCLALENIYVDENNDFFCSVDGILYSKDMKTLYFYPPGKSETSFIVPDSVEVIYGNYDICIYAFAYCTNLEEIILPENLIEINACSFVGCTFETIELPKNLVSIGVDAFALNPNLREIAIPESLENIYNPFYGCDNLETVIILDHTLEPFGLSSNPNNNKDIHYRYMFFNNEYDLSDVTTIYVPDNKLNVYIEEFPENYTVLPLSEIPKEIITGDVNYDQTVSTADIVMMQKSFAKSDGMKLMKAADMNGDGKLNVFDLILLKRKIQNM